jgi:hypothetical protein
MKLKSYTVLLCFLLPFSAKASEVPSVAYNVKGQSKSESSSEGSSTVSIDVPLIQRFDKFDEAYVDEKFELAKENGLFAYESFNTNPQENLLAMFLSVAKPHDVIEGPLGFKGFLKQPVKVVAKLFLPKKVEGPLPLTIYFPGSAGMRKTEEEIAKKLNKKAKEAVIVIDSDGSTGIGNTRKNQLKSSIYAKALHGFSLIAALIKHSHPAIDMTKKVRVIGTSIGSLAAFEMANKELYDHLRTFESSREHENPYQVLPSFSPIGRFDLIHYLPVMRDRVPVITGGRIRFYAAKRDDWNVQHATIAFCKVCRRLGINMDVIPLKGGHDAESCDYKEPKKYNGAQNFSKTCSSKDAMLKHFAELPFTSKTTEEEALKLLNDLPRFYMYGQNGAYGSHAALTFMDWMETFMKGITYGGTGEPHEESHEKLVAHLIQGRIDLNKDEEEE